MPRVQHGQTQDMKRTPLKRSTTSMKRSPLKRVSKARAKITPARTAFTKQMREERPYCEIKLEGCIGQPIFPHEAIRRSAGGAIVPGEKADAQGQVFWAACNFCNGELANTMGELTELAISKGWIQPRRGH